MYKSHNTANGHKCLHYKFCRHFTPNQYLTIFCILFLSAGAYCLRYMLASKTMILLKPAWCTTSKWCCAQVHRHWKTSNLGGAANFLPAKSKRSREHSEKLPEFPIVLSEKLPKWNGFLSNWGGCSPLATPSPMLMPKFLLYVTMYFNTSDCNLYCGKLPNVLTLPWQSLLDTNISHIPMLFTLYFSSYAFSPNHR